MVANNCHCKTKNLTAKPKTSRQKQNTSRQNQKPHGSRQTQKPHGKKQQNTSQQKPNSFGFAVGICFCREVFGFCLEVFGFAMRSLVLPWGFCCREVFCFCREVFGFALRYFVFAVTVVGHRSPQIFGSELFFTQTQCLQCGDTMSVGSCGLYSTSRL